MILVKKKFSLDFLEYQSYLARSIFAIKLREKGEESS